MAGYIGNVVAQGQCRRLGDGAAIYCRAIVMVGHCHIISARSCSGQVLARGAVAPAKRVARSRCAARYTQVDTACAAVAVYIGHCSSQYQGRGLRNSCGIKSSN